MYLYINSNRLLIYGLVAGIFPEKRFSNFSGAFSATALSVLPGFVSLPEFQERLSQPSLPAPECPCPVCALVSAS